MSLRRVALLLAGSLLAGCGSRAPAPSAPAPVPVRPAPPATASAAPSPPPAPAPPAFPRTVSFDAFGEGERIADLAAIGVEDGVLLAWVTYFDPGVSAPPGAPPSRKGPPAAQPRAGGPAGASRQGASVMVRPLDAKGEPTAQPSTVSIKGDPVGGVALAPDSSSAKEVALGWVGREAGVGQVFLTRVSRAGEKRAQKMLTRSRTGCSDVALAPTGDGWIVGWVESHDGVAEVYAARVARDLRVLAGPRRVLENKGEASDLRLLARTDDVLAAWSETARGGQGTRISAVRLRASDLAVRGDPVAIGRTARQARGLELKRLGDGAALAWIDDAPPTGTKPEEIARHVVFAELDASGRPTAEPARLPLASDTTAVALDCGQTCRAVVSGAEAGEFVLDGFELGGARPPGRPARLQRIAGISTEDVSPVLVDDWLFFAEDDLHGAGRVRRAKLAWR